MWNKRYTRQQNTEKRVRNLLKKWEKKIDENYNQWRVRSSILLFEYMAKLSS